ncbi:LysR family transcriptional regulator [Klebsiella quasipneumoniae]|uniref:LysR family transcriptional regulator n=1 Tax=Klebsiella quasipneumoniae TaxID=1463165 RepID=UPI001BABB9BC|nr:LysR family transcriptional regulator [Klebsiella quasipneumoniae]MBS3685072.1 LysR family transcriptional regulator [Klebsiella quasipneumoniae]
MELSQLKMFKTVVEQGSIAKASEILHCVPSNITNRIKLLEEDLGEALFMRKGRGLVITPSGEIFLGYVCKILAFCEEARRALEPSSEPSGVLRIGAIETAATGRLPTVLSKFHQGYPAVQMQFSTGTWQQLVRDVADHKLDGAIVATKSEHPDVSHVEIYKESLVLIASPFAGQISGPMDLIGKNIYMWPQGCPYRQALERWLHEHKVPVDIASIASYGTILGCVTAGAGVSLVPAGVFEQFQRIGDIKGYKFRELSPVQNYFIKNNSMGVHRARDAFEALLYNELKKI